MREEENPSNLEPDPEYRVDMFRVGMIILLLGFVFNVVETAIFGWNAQAESRAEMICDYISLFIMGYGVFIAFDHINRKITIMRRKTK